MHVLILAMKKNFGADPKLTYAFYFKRKISKIQKKISQAKSNPTLCGSALHPTSPSTMPFLHKICRRP